VIECLLLYAWPENLRELRGLVRTLAISGEAAFPWATDQLPAKLRRHRSVLRGPEIPSPGDERTPPRPEPTRAEIEDALARTNGRMRTAATLLGVDRRKLYRLCERFGIAIDAHREGAPDD
jgi:transcriptional regulator of acetoin/glycerol metabolism